jgi:hypothetical protein
MEVVVKGSERFNCHQFMLAARSPVLAAMLKHPMQVNTVKQCCGTVTIYYRSGSGSDFWKVMVPVPVPTFEKLWFQFLLLKKLRFRFRF